MFTLVPTTTRHVCIAIGSNNLFILLFRQIKEGRHVTDRRPYTACQA